MITAHDVNQFMQKYADGVLPDPTDVKPEPSATGTPGIGGRIGGYIKKNPINAAFMGYQVYGMGQAMKDRWSQYDVNEDTENQLAQYAQQINTLDKRNPFMDAHTPIKNDFQKDMDEYGFAEANFRHVDREGLKQKEQELTERKSDPADKKDYTMTGQFQRAYNTKTVPVTASRYQRG